MASKKQFLKNDKSGIAALLTVVIIGAAVLLMVLASSFLSLGELELGYNFQKAGEALSLADGCLEEALYRISLDSNYGLGVGDINLAFSNGYCIINISSNADQRTISILSRVDDYYKKIEARADLSGGAIVLIAWEEKDD